MLKKNGTPHGHGLLRRGQHTPCQQKLSPADGRKQTLVSTPVQGKRQPGDIRHKPGVPEAVAAPQGSAHSAHIFQPCQNGKLFGLVARQRQHTRINKQ